MRGTYDRPYIRALLDLKRLLKEKMKIHVCCANNIGFYSKYQFYFIVEISENIFSFPGFIRLIFHNNEHHAHKFQFHFDCTARPVKLWLQTEENVKKVTSLGAAANRAFFLRKR